MKAYKTVKETKQELRKVASAIAGTDRFIAQSLPLLIEEIQLIRKRLDDLCYYLKPPPEELENGEESK